MKKFPNYFLANVLIALYIVKVYASSYNVEIFNSRNSELQLKDTESAIKNTLKIFLTELRGFNFVTILVLVSKKIESDDYDTFY